MISNMKRRIANILEQMKGFEIGWSTASKNQIMVDFTENEEMRRYLITITEIKNPAESMHTDMRNHFNEK